MEQSVEHRADRRDVAVACTNDAAQRGAAAWCVNTLPCPNETHWIPRQPRSSAAARTCGDRRDERLQQLVAEIAALRGEDGAQQLALELAKVQEDLARLQQQAFGDSSERRPRTAEATPEEKPRQPGHGPRQQPQLPIQEVLCVLPREDRSCPSCGNELQEMVGVTEDSEQVTVVQRHFVLQEIKRQKYRCKCQLGVQTARAPTKHIAGGRYSLEFAVEVATNKYADHLPLERQRKVMAREGLFIDTQTLWDQLDALAVHLKPTYKGLREYVLGADVIAADERGGA